MTTEHKLVPGMPQLRILVTNTKVPKETGKLVAGVRVLRDSLPGPIDHVISAIQCISDAALEGIAKAANASLEGDSKHDGSAADVDGELFSSLRQLVRLNHCLLNGLGVGHPALDQVVAVTASQGFSSKLTGAGGGGCALTLLPPRGEGNHDVEARVAAVMTSMRAAGFSCFETGLGGHGLLLLRAGH